MVEMSPWSRKFQDRLDIKLACSTSTDLEYIIPEQLWVAIAPANHDTSEIEVEVMAS